MALLCDLLLSSPQAMAAPHNDEADRPRCDVARSPGLLLMFFMNKSVRHSNRRVSHNPVESPSHTKAVHLQVNVQLRH